MLFRENPYYRSFQYLSHRICNSQITTKRYFNIQIFLQNHRLFLPFTLKKKSILTPLTNSFSHNAWDHSLNPYTFHLPYFKHIDVSILYFHPKYSVADSLSAPKIRLRSQTCRVATISRLRRLSINDQSFYSLA